MNFLDYCYRFSLFIYELFIHILLFPIGVFNSLKDNQSPLLSEHCLDALIVLIKQWAVKHGTLIALLSFVETPFTKNLFVLLRRSNSDCDGSDWHNLWQTVCFFFTLSIFSLYQFFIKLIIPQSSYKLKRISSISKQAFSSTLFPPKPIFTHKHIFENTNYSSPNNYTRDLRLVLSNTNIFSIRKISLAHAFLRPTFFNFNYQI